MQVGRVVLMQLMRNTNLSNHSFEYLLPWFQEPETVL